MSQVNQCNEFNSAHKAPSLSLQHMESSRRAFSRYCFRQRRTISFWSRSLGTLPSRPRASSRHCAVFTAFAGIIGCASTTLFTATIFLDQSGITAQVAGIRTKTISWEEIKKIEKFFTRDNLLRWVAVYKPMGKYQGKLGGFFPNTLGHIAFTTRIKNHEDLVEQLNHYARKYGIPQFVTAENNVEIRVEKF
ncbi:MAG: hypothetical protein KUG59_09505 [Parvibaculaceae bacterium]|nr:hypothetical protein [Parvibaculaceae bacterium]